MANTIRIGTYNTNNLFDRFDDPYNFRDDPWRAAWEGSSPKSLTDLYQLGARIRASGVDVLGLQEIESFDALHDFAQGQIGPEYKVRDGIVSLQSNDPRGIDLGLLTKLPVGRVISHRYRKADGSLVFSRDCLQVEILAEDRSKTLLTLFICHLKSKYSQFERGTRAYEEDRKRSNERRRSQVLETIQIVQDCMDVENDRFAIVGDMNDTPDSPALVDFLAPDNPLQVVNALASIPQDDESTESKKKRKRDTHKWTRTGEDGKTLTTYSQLDYILLSKALARGFTGNAKVEQHKYTSGSDHFLCWAEVDVDRL